MMMKISYKCYLAKHTIMYETGMLDERETVSIVFEFNADDGIVQRLAYEFFNPITAVEIDLTWFQELKQLEGLTGIYIGNINDVIPSFRIISDDQLKLSTKNYSLSATIDMSNLNKYGFKSLKELALMETNFQVLFTTINTPNGSDRNIYQSHVFPPKIEN